MAAQGELLKDALKGWRNGLSDEWRSIFAGVEPYLAALNELKTVDSHPLPNGSGPSPGAGAAAPRHLTRAFDNITPDKVRVVVIGEDPYPEKEKATGRAFEDGRWKKEMPSDVARSLKKLLQSAAAHKLQKLEIAKDDQGWDAVCDAIKSGDLLAPATPGHFNFLAEQGVLFVNAAWTFTKVQATSAKDKKSEKKRNQSMHQRAWMPVMARLVQELTRPERRPSIVFLLLGEKARDRFMSAVCDYEIDGLKAISVRMATVYCAHPVAPSGKGRKTYFDYENPLARVNTELTALETTPIQWWPRPQPEKSA